MKSKGYEHIHQSDIGVFACVGGSRGWNFTFFNPREQYKRALKSKAIAIMAGERILRPGFLLLVSLSYVCYGEEVSIEDQLVSWPFPDNYDDSRSQRSVLEAPSAGSRSTNTYQYGELLHMSILFYETQRSGRLPDNNRIPWRGHSALFDRGKMKSEELIGGWYDAGSNMKFLFPMAYSATVLGWGMIEYPDAYEVTGLTPYMLDCLKWVYDFLITCHTKRNRLYFQVGDFEVDHQGWIRPEDIEDERPAFYVSPQNPGSDVSAEISAAMVTCYLIFSTTDPDYAAMCLKEAKYLYRFATTYQGKYPDTGSYGSTGFGDELMWASAWLYRATNDTRYLEDAEKYYREYDGDQLSYAFGWNDKRPAVQLLLYGLTANNDYMDHFKRYVDSWLPGGRVKYTPKGLAWRHRIGPLRYSAATSFLALIGADLGIETETYRDFAVNQIHYMLGDAGHSYVVGYGWEPPRRPQHRASSCPDLKLPCTRFHDYLNDGPNRHVLYGALVGGPNSDDSFEDRRTNFAQNSVACDYNAGFQSAIAGLRHLEANGELQPKE
ncbi:endoglucanase E-4-like [Glandiceps talaboti]